MFNAYSQLVDIYAARESTLKDLPKALEAYNTAKRLSPDDEALFQLDLSVVEAYWQLGRYDEALRIYVSGLQLARQRSNKWGEANALLSMAEVERSMGRLKDARKHIAEAEPLTFSTHDIYMVGRLYYGSAKLAQAEGALGESARWFQKVIALLEDVKTTNAQTPSNIADNYSFIYGELLAVLYKLYAQSADPVQFASEAFSVAESNKARLFLKSWGRKFAEAARRQLPPALQEKERAVFVRVAEAEDHLLQARVRGNPADMAEAEAQFLQARQDYTTFIDELRNAHRRYAELLEARGASVASLPLRTGELLVEFKCLDDAVLVWGILGSTNGNKVQVFYKSDVARQWVRDKITHVRSGLNSSHPEDFGASDAEELFHKLISPRLMEAMADASSITVVPDDFLYLLPIEILSPDASKGGFVFAEKPFRYLPAASALQVVRSQVAREWTKQFFGVADPITSISDDRYEIAYLGEHSATRLDEGRFAQQRARGLTLDRIPATAQEVRTIAALFASGTELRIGSEANKNNVTAMELSRFRFLHFATHGLLPVGSGISEPALVLSYDGHSPQNMLFTMSDVLGLSINADMVTLSACNTGTGQVSRAEGVFNLGRAFLAAGAANVTVSLWQVADESTAILMKSYYSKMLAGKSKAEALASARKALAANPRFRSPFYWSAFVLVGD